MVRWSEPIARCCRRTTRRGRLRPRSRSCRAPVTDLRQTSTAATHATITTARNDVSLWNAMSHSSRAWTSPGKSGLLCRVNVFQASQPAQKAPIVDRDRHVRLGLDVDEGDDRDRGDDQRRPGLVAVVPEVVPHRGDEVAESAGLVGRSRFARQRSSAAELSQHRTSILSRRRGTTRDSGSRRRSMGSNPSPPGRFSARSVRGGARPTCRLGAGRCAGAAVRAVR